ncbi:uncharacterized protein LOC123523184 [Mercenaria mercenaria]|uniref:uncharacterized protein LOC123523184 n=1 Tax=Mercenaria mercenaria TaxID=6596 RepID=UPI00234F0546|nr:uncharacterized protein LOC123523184 [Mercenaria mercenaria]
MSASARPSGEYVAVSRNYVNEQEVGFISTHQSRDSHQHEHVTLNEIELIERVKLTSSELEVNKLRSSGNFNVSDCISYPSAEGSHELEQQKLIGDEDASKLQDINDYVSAVDPDTDDATMFYETQTDETTLIKYAKLAEGGLDEETKLGNKLMQHIIYITDTKTKSPPETAEENEDGFQTPVNSETGDAATDEVKKQLAMCYHLSAKPSIFQNKADRDIKQMRPYCQENLDSEVTDEPMQGIIHRSVKADEFAVADEDLRDPDFERLILEVVKHLQDCDLDEILSMFSGSGILEMTGLLPPAQLMQVLQKHRLISRDNLHHIQGIIMRLDDTDLYIKAVQYIKHHNDIVYFYQDQDIPTKGFGKVQCFISGRDFTRLTREDLELVRFKVASLVFMPAHYVYIVGIEPGSRIMVTLMLLERYVQELSEMAKEGLPELVLVHVDAIQIFGKTYSTTGTTAVEKYHNSGHASFISVYQQLRDKSKRLEERDEEVTKLQEEVEFMQLELETMGSELEMLTEKAVRESVTRRRIQSRPINKHPRTRSFPLSYRDKLDDKKFALALESAVITNTVQCPGDNDNVRMSLNICKTDIMTHSAHIKDKESSAIVLQDKKHEMFQQTDDLMGEIEVILNELVCTSC